MEAYTRQIEEVDHGPLLKEILKVSLGFVEEYIGSPEVIFVLILKNFSRGLVTHKDKVGALSNVGMEP